MGDTLTLAPPPGRCHAVAREVTHGCATAIRSGCAPARLVDRRGLSPLPGEPENRLQMARALRESRARGFDRSLASALHVSSRHAWSDRAADLGPAAPISLG